MTIVDKIITSIQSGLAEPVNVYYHDDNTLNVMTSGMTMPCAIVKLLTTGRAVTQSWQTREVVSAAVFFIDRSEFDFDAVENERIIDACKARAFEWLRSLQVGGLLRVAGEYRTSRIYDTYDDIVTGFGVFVDLMEAVGSCGEIIQFDFNNDYNTDFLS